MSNLSTNAVSNLVADYAFVMHSREVKTVTTIVSTVSNKSGVSATSVVPDLALVYKDSVVTKSRGHATPYGFGIKYDSLTGSQFGILAALGMSRGRF